LADIKLGVIGVGKMGEALVAGLLRSQIVANDDVLACDLRETRRRHVSDTYHVTCVPEAERLADSVGVIVLAVQPAQLPAVLTRIRAHVTPRHLLISIVAGVSTRFILQQLQHEVPVIRAMPNNPCMVGEGVTALATTSLVTAEHLDLAKTLFTALGRIVILDERHFDAVTGLSGSGPAYVYLFIEALADGGVKVGLPKDVALLLAAQTVAGSGRMVVETGSHPALLRDAVATPAGTTVHGLLELEAGRLRATVVKAVEQATRRAEELGS
jgi:pyrroline-5-carboxylate reductase